MAARLTPSNGNASVLDSNNGRLSSTNMERRQILVVEWRAFSGFGVEAERLGAVENGSLITLGERESGHQGQNNGCGQSLDRGVHYDMIVDCNVIDEMNWCLRRVVCVRRIKSVFANGRIEQSYMS